MKKSLLAILGAAFVCMLGTNGNAGIVRSAKYGLHVAGGPGTCDFVLADCLTAVTQVDMPDDGITPWRGDIYVIAMDAWGLAGVRYGLKCEVARGVGFFFYGWTNCADLEIPSAGWPGCGQDNAQTWFAEQAGSHTAVGILDVYIYGGTNAKLCTTVDSRVGYAEACDGASPEPLCHKRTGRLSFGCVGFDRRGYNPCGITPVEKTSWGAVKALYR